MSLDANKIIYKYTMIGRLQAYIDIAGGYKSRNDCLDLTLEEFFDSLPQNGITINFEFDPKFRNVMQDGEL